MADAAEAGDGDGAVALAVAVPGDGAVAVVVGVALMGSAGYWLPFVRSLGRLVAWSLSLSAVVGPAHWPLELATHQQPNNNNNNNKNCRQTICG